MRSIGFRAEKNAIHWAVVEPKGSDILKLVAHGEINAGATETIPGMLASFREQVRLLIDQQKPDVAVVRMPETFGRRAGNAASLDNRLRVEGVIIESAASKSVDVRPTALKGISSLMKSHTAKAYLDGEQLRGIDWPNKKLTSREAILAAAAGVGVMQ